jgi:hypothetical protein
MNAQDRTLQNVTGSNLGADRLSADHTSQNSISPASYRRSITSCVNEAISLASKPENSEMPGRTAGFGLAMPLV